MFFTISLYLSLAIFLLGTIYKISGWFRYRLGTDGSDVSPAGRVFAALKGIILTILSPKLGTLVKVFVLDVLLQLRTIEESTLRWFMHICIFIGFILLIIFHAVDEWTAARWFEEYSPTLNPNMFLRNLFGVLVIVGVVIAFYRRAIMKIPRLITKSMDKYAIMIVAVIIFSGFFLEAVKIGSYNDFTRMVEEYSDTDDEQEIKALESYWVEEFGVVSPRIKGPFEKEVLTAGFELHETSCQACHSKPQWAPVSYGIATIIKPAALALEKINLSAILYYIHFLACFIGLAYLPFSKMFHLFSSPVSLLANAVMDNKKSDPANIATRQIMELDACTHCGTCSTRCSVGICFEEIGNENILPSEKLASVKALAAGNKLGEKDIRSIQEGLYLCTNCKKCTVVCPVGINLQDLWFNVRETVLAKGYPELLALSPLSYYRGLKRDELKPDTCKKTTRTIEKGINAQLGPKLADMEQLINQTHMDQSFRKELGKSFQSGTFTNCFTCMTCSSSCPVVWNYEKPTETLGLIPHQLIRAAVLGLPELIYSSNMLWRCLGCYQCQENCPQGVAVADIFYELKDRAAKHFNGKLPNA